LVGTDNPRLVLEEVRRFLNDSGMVSLSDLERGLGITPNWLSGFMSALEALGLVKCKGTRTYKLYMLVEEKKIISATKKLLYRIRV